MYDSITYEVMCVFQKGVESREPTFGKLQKTNYFDKERLRNLKLLP